MLIVASNAIPKHGNNNFAKTAERGLAMDFLPTPKSCIVFLLHVFWNTLYVKTDQLVHTGYQNTKEIVTLSGDLRLVESGIYAAVISKHYRFPATPSDAYVLVAQRRVGFSLASIGPACPRGMGSSINKKSLVFKSVI